MAGLAAGSTRSRMTQLRRWRPKHLSSNWPPEVFQMSNLDSYTAALECLGEVMRRREFIGLVGGALIAGNRASIAQSPGRVYRIGVLETVDAISNRPNLDAFRQGMTDKGYIENRDYVIDYKSANGHTESFQQLADELVRANVDIIVTRGTPAALAAKAATVTIPIVMSAVGDPTLAVASLAKPGGNVTGLASLTEELVAKRTAILKEMTPSAQRLVALLNMSNPTLLSDWTELQRVGVALGLTTILLDVRRSEDIVAAFERARAIHADGMIVSTDTVTQANRTLIAELAAKDKLPTIYPSREFIDAGGLVMYGVNYPDLYRRAAEYVHRIFNGAQPADLPVEQPTKFELIVNLKAAKALALTVPPTLLALADEVIE
jgi:putative tryptophan/tyrosine transport system substrate-binding protein